MSCIGRPLLLHRPPAPPLPVHTTMPSQCITAFGTKLKLDSKPIQSAHLLHPTVPGTHCNLNEEGPPQEWVTNSGQNPKKKAQKKIHTKKPGDCFSGGRLGKNPLVPPTADCFESEQWGEWGCGERHNGSKPHLPCMHAQKHARKHTHTHTHTHTHDVYFVSNGGALSAVRA